MRHLAAAKAALARSGYRGAPIRLSYASDRPVHGIDLAVVAKAIRTQLAQIGVRVTLAPAPMTKALADYEKGTNAMGLWGLGRPNTSKPRPRSRSPRAATWRTGPGGCAA